MGLGRGLDGGRGYIDCSFRDVVPTYKNPHTMPHTQPALDAAMGKEEQGRCFVRPSGTEDVVRIYAGAFGFVRVSCRMQDWSTPFLSCVVRVKS